MGWRLSERVLCFNRAPESAVHRFQSCGRSKRTNIEEDCGILRLWQYLGLGDFQNIFERPEETEKTVGRLEVEIKDHAFS